MSYRPTVLAAFALCVGVVLLESPQRRGLRSRCVTARVRPKFSPMPICGRRARRTLRAQVVSSTSETVASAVGLPAASQSGEAVGSVAGAIVEATADAASTGTAAAASTGIGAKMAGLKGMVTGAQAKVIPVLEQIPLMPQVLAVLGFFWGQLAWGSPLSYIVLGIFINRAYNKYRQFKTEGGFSNALLRNMMQQTGRSQKEIDEMMMMGAKGAPQTPDEIMRQMQMLMGGPSTGGASAPAAAAPPSPSLPKELENDFPTMATSSSAKKAPSSTVTEAVITDPAKSERQTSPASSRPTSSSSEDSTRKESDEATGAMSGSIIDHVMTDKKLQDMVMPYLPETMRDLDSLKLMLKNPTFRAQLEKALETGGLAEKARAGENGASSSTITPDQIAKKVMDDPDLAKAFENPKVQKAIFDSSTDPTKFVDYSNDPEIMKALTKIAETFPADQLRQIR